jgi:hypothetical protein
MTFLQQAQSNTSCAEIRIWKRLLHRVPAYSARSSELRTFDVADQVSRSGLGVYFLDVVAWRQLTRQKLQVFEFPESTSFQTRSPHLRTPSLYNHWRGSKALNLQQINTLRRILDRPDSKMCHLGGLSDEQDSVCRSLITVFRHFPRFATNFSLYAHLSRLAQMRQHDSSAPRLDY